MTELVSLGIDPSTKTGVVVVGVRDNQPEVLFSTRLESSKKGFDRALEIASGIQPIVEEYNSDFVTIEGYGYGNTHTLATLVEIGTLIRLVLYSQNQRYTVLPPTVLKKLVTGRGNAGKEHILLALYQRWGVEFATNDEADAFGLALAPLVYEGVLSVPKAHKDALRKMQFFRNCN